MTRTSPRHGHYALGTVLLLGLCLPAQEHRPAAAAGQAAPAEHKRGSKEAPTHRPSPVLPPLTVLEHLRAGNRAAAAARAAGKPCPDPAPRPAGAGRYLCAVFVCSDADLDVAALLGLARRDVLVFANPGPFVTPEALAALEDYVSEERLPLIVVLGHQHCRVLHGGPARTPYRKVLDRRVAEVARQATAAGHSLTKALVRSQREVILASSEVIRAAGKEDQVRVVAAEVDDGTLEVTWHVRPAEALPMPVVR